MDFRQQQQQHVMFNDSHLASHAKSLATILDEGHSSGRGNNNNNNNFNNNSNDISDNASSSNLSTLSEEEIRDQRAHNLLQQQDLRSKTTPGPVQKLQQLNEVVCAVVSASGRVEAAELRETLARAKIEELVLTIERLQTEMENKERHLSQLLKDAVRNCNQADGIIRDLKEQLETRNRRIATLESEVSILKSHQQHLQHEQQANSQQQQQQQQKYRSETLNANGQIISTRSSNNDDDTYGSNYSMVPASKPSRDQLVPRLPLNRLAVPSPLGFIERATTPTSARNGQDTHLAIFLQAQKDLTDKQTRLDTIQREFSDATREVEIAKLARDTAEQILEQKELESARSLEALRALKRSTGGASSTSSSVKGGYSPSKDALSSSIHNYDMVRSSSPAQLSVRSTASSSTHKSQSHYSYPTVGYPQQQQQQQQQQHHHQSTSSSSISSQSQQLTRYKPQSGIPQHLYPSTSASHSWKRSSLGNQSTTTTTTSQLSSSGSQLRESSSSIRSLSRSSASIDFVDNPIHQSNSHNHHSNSNTYSSSIKRQQQHQIIPQSQWGTLAAPPSITPRAMSAGMSSLSALYPPAATPFTLSYPRFI